ncbi:MAG: hypothetical protein OXD44_10400 [Gammaproteobacteria bacterium]|nr:hypothetical protein [Gammaproteobacteria bacterium]
MKPLDDLFAEDSDDLRVKLNQIDVSIPPRTQGRTSQHREAWVARHFLETIADTDLLEYPIHIKHQDRPDFLLSSQDSTTGVEITIAEHVNHARAEALSEHMEKNNDRGLSDCMYVPVYHPHEKKLPKQEILKSATGEMSYPAMGRELEDNWIDAMMDSVKKKDSKFKSSGFKKHDRNWLLIYDNWSPFPSGLGDHDFKYLAKELHGSRLQNTFDKIFIFRNSGRQNSYKLLDFPPTQRNMSNTPFTTSY